MSEKKALQVLVPETEFRRTHTGLKSSMQKIDFADCPVEASLGVLGKKWTMLIIRDIGGYGVDRFSGLRKSLPRIPVKVLATRLNELKKGGFILNVVEKSKPPKIVRWSLTEKGVDAMRVGMVLGAFGSRWFADRVFDDKRPRGMSEICTREGLEFFMKIF